MQTTFKMPVDESLIPPKFDEPISIINLETAWRMLDAPYESLTHHFINALHIQLIFDILQRNTLATNILVSPNIVAELFTWDEANKHRDYIARRLIGNQLYNNHLTKDRDTIWRQAYRKMKAMQIDLIQLFFFYHGIPNYVYKDGDGWHLGQNTPIYRSLYKLSRTQLQAQP